MKLTAALAHNTTLRTLRLDRCLSKAKTRVAAVQALADLARLATTVGVLAEPHAAGAGDAVVGRHQAQGRAGPAGRRPGRRLPVRQWIIIVFVVFILFSGL